MGAAYVSLDDRMPAHTFVVLGPSSSMRAELSAIAVEDAPVVEDLTILTDSLSSIVKLQAMQRRGFPEWLHVHPETTILLSVVGKVNARARAGVHTGLVKVPAHKAHPLAPAQRGGGCRRFQSSRYRISGAHTRRQLRG